MKKKEKISTLKAFVSIEDLGFYTGLCVCVWTGQEFDLEIFAVSTLWFTWLFDFYLSLFFDSDHLILYFY